MDATLTLIDLAGSIALLLWGVHMVQSGIQRAFGPNLRRVLGAALGGGAKAFLAGLGITAVLQSSTATGLMVTGFAAGGLVDLVPGLAAMLGANVGTTLIVQLLSFDISRVAPLFILIGVIMFRRGGITRTRDLGRVGIGLGLILIALTQLLAILTPYEDVPSLRLLLGMIATVPIIDVIVGAALTWAAHSSVAIVLLIMSFAAQGTLLQGSAGLPARACRGRLAVHNRKPSAVPFKHHAEHRHHIPRPRYRVTNRPEYEAALRRRGSLTVWFTDEAIAAWRAEPRTTPGGQPHYSTLAITTALTMRTVFGLALGQAGGLIGSVIALLGLALAVPDPSTLSRRSKTLEVPPRRRLGAGPLHLLVDSTGLKLGGAGEWLVEKHGTSRRRSWRKLHIGIDGESGEIVAIELTKKESDDSARTDALLDQLIDPLASFTADGAYDQDRVYETVAQRHPDAAVIVPPRATAVPGPSATTAPTQRDRHIQEIVAHGRMGWQKSSGYNLRAKVEAAIGRYRRVIGDTLRSRSDKTEATEVAIAAAALNRMLEFGRPNYVRIS